MSWLVLIVVIAVAYYYRAEIKAKVLAWYDTLVSKI